MPTFTKVFLPNTLALGSFDISEDKQAMTTVLNYLQVHIDELPPRERERNLGENQNVDSRSATLFVQLGDEVDTCDVTVRIAITVSVQLMPGSRALLVTRLAGTTFTDEPSGKDKEFVYTYSSMIRSKKGFLVTFFLLVDRDIVDGGLPAASAAIDSVDFSFETLVALDCKP